MSSTTATAVEASKKLDKAAQLKKTFSPTSPKKTHKPAQIQKTDKSSQTQKIDKPNQPQNCVLLQSRDSGMFSIFFDVIALLQSYENGFFSYVEVNFGKTGLYYDKTYGPNWWEYYFQPVIHGVKTQPPRRILGLEEGVDPWKVELETSKHEVNRIIKKYISVKPAIQDEINAFANRHFQKNFVIGIHYRGTDKKFEAPRVGYEQVTKHVLETVDKLKTDKYKIFVATDEKAFLDYMVSIFQDKVCWVKEVQHSTDNTPMHMRSDNRFLMGKSAVMDCMLLSKTNLLIRTSSNLSKVSMYFNPKLEVIEVSQRNPKYR